MSEHPKHPRMIARHIDYDVDKGLVDLFPTPPWAARAFMTYVMPEANHDQKYLVLEPACGLGSMVKPFKEYGYKVTARDIIDHGFRCRKIDFLKTTDVDQFDYVITNPPYKIGDEFYYQALSARRGVALLCRIQFVSSLKRYRGIYTQRRPTKIALITGKMPARMGRVVQHASQYFDHAWFWWDLTKRVKKTEFVWIPPDAQKLLEKPEDYE